MKQTRPAAAGMGGARRRVGQRTVMISLEELLMSTEPEVIVAGTPIYAVIPNLVVKLLGSLKKLIALLRR